MQPVFVSRHKELAKLGQLLESAVAGQGQVCFVTGEAGIGKTSLTAEFARRAQQQHRELLVAIGDCNSQTGMGDPYLPFREVLGMLAGDIDDRLAQGMTTEENANRLRDFLQMSKRIIKEVGPDLIDIFVPGVGIVTRAGAVVAGEDGPVKRRSANATSGQPSPWSLDTEQGRIFEQVTRVLVTLASERPLILILDDLHWIDDSSAGLLFHLARRIEGSRILVIGTFRPEEVALKRGKLNHPMAQIVPEVKRHYGDVVIRLAGEDVQEARDFVDALLDTQPNKLGSEFRRRLLERTRGHPLFTTELLREMLERGALLRDDDGELVVGPELDWEALPARAEGVIEQRINRLDDRLREILTIASVHSESFAAQVIASLLGEPERQVLASLSRELAQVHDLVREEGNERVGRNRISLFRFRHQLFREYFYDRLGTAERELLHENVAEALESLYAGHTEKIALELARHYENAGLFERAAEFFLRCSRRANDIFAFNEAIALAGRGLECLGQAGEDPANRELVLDLRMALGSGQYHAGQVAEAMETFRSTAALAIEQGAAEAAARAAIAFSEPQWRYNVVDATCLRLLDNSLEMLGPEDSVLRATALAALARASEQHLPLDRLLGLLDEATRMARRLGDPRAVIDCTRVRVSLDRAPERIRDRLELLDEAFRLARELDDKHMLLEATGFRIFERVAVAAPEVWETDLDTLRRLSEEVGDPFFTYHESLLRAAADINAGRFDAAEQRVLAAFKTGQQLGVENVEGALGVQMFTIRREQGRLREVAPLVRRFVDEHGSGAAWRPGLAVIYAEIGDLESAKHQLDDLAREDFAAVPRDALRGACLSYLADVSAELNDTARAEALYEHLLPFRDLAIVVGNATACLGSSGRFLGRLATVLGRFEAAEEHFEAALALDSRFGARPWLARGRYHFARMLQARGRPGDAERAAELLEAARAAAQEVDMGGLARRISESAG